MQDAPFTIQIELAEGCNIKVPRSDGTRGLCEHCGLNAIRPGVGDYRFMTIETAEHVAAQIAAAGWNSQLLFAMHGEPSMNPRMLDIISVFRQALPRAYMVMLSNGGGFIRPGMLDAALDAGLNTLGIEKYEGAGLYERIDWQSKYPIRDYPLDLKANPHKRHRKRQVVRIDDIALASRGTHSVLNNHAGSGMPPNKDYWGKRCSKPFREVGVRWDGTVSGCCVMWRNEVEAGNVGRSSIEEIWNGPVLNAMRRILIAGRRDLIDACSKCDHPSYRVGLLPDKYGKQKLPDFTPEDVALLCQAKSSIPIQIVRRRWEQNGTT